MTKLILIKLNECIKILIMSFSTNWISFSTNWISLHSYIFYFIHLKTVLEVVSRLYHTAKEFPGTRRKDYKPLSSAGYTEVDPVGKNILH